MKNVFTIVKKEFARFFKDKRMIITVLLPGLLIYVVYSIMGTVATEMMKTPPVGEKVSAYVENMPENPDLAAQLDLILEIDGETTSADAKEKVENGSLDLYIIFPENFDVAINGNTESTPDVRIYYNSAEETSQYAYMSVCGILESFKGPAFSINGDMLGDLADKRTTSGQMLASFMPMLMFALLVSGCVAVAPESIAGEKERGTMATMLITPIKRWQLALGKIISLSCFALLSGISSFIGVILSLPKLMGGMSGGELAISYGFGDYAMIFGLIISAVLVVISVFSILSAFAKSVKEAGTLISPLMMLIIVLGVVSMILSNPSVGLFAIPLLGSQLAMSAIFKFSLPPLGFVLALISNLVLAVALVVVLSFMFKSEKIMFNK